MATISIIAAIGKNNELGYKNDLIWHFKEDLAHFKELTMGKKIIMGSNTYKSLPKTLEGREYIILSKSLSNIPNALIFKEMDALLKYIDTLDEEVMIIGGASIYKLFLPYADKLYLTEIDADDKADVYFPEIDKNNYSKEIIDTKEEKGIHYSFCIYEKVR